jgi:hypothetical protein
MTPFARFESSTTQANVQTNTDIVLGTSVYDTNADVTNAAGSAQIVLQPGTYYLEGGAGGTTTNTGGLTPAGARLNYVFYNQTTGTFFGAAGGHTAPSNAASFSSPQGPATAVITVTTPTTVTLRMSGTDQTVTLNQQADGGQGGQSWVNVWQLS